MIQRILIIAAFLCVGTASEISAQSKFFSNSSRGGAEGAKQNAQVTTLQGENERMNACTIQGRIYAPTHPNRDVDDCIPHLTLDPATGAATFTNGLTINSGGTAVTGDSTFNNNLTVGGTSTVSVTSTPPSAGAGPVGNCLFGCR